MVNPSMRICALPACGVMLRPDSRDDRLYCGEMCRTRGHRARNGRPLRASEIRDLSNRLDDGSMTDAAFREHVRRTLVTAGVTT